MEAYHLERALDLAWSTVIKMVDGFFSALPNLIIGLVVLVMFFYLGKITKELVGNVSARARMDVTLGRALGTVCSVMVCIFGVLTAGVIVIPHFSMASVIGGLGISSVAIGFAFKDILQNFFAGMLLLWQKPFAIGDQIRTQSFEGTVEDIRIRSTLLRTFDGELVLIPNGDIYTNAVTVLTASQKRKIHLTCTAKNAESVSEARQKVTKLLSQTEGVMKEPPPMVYVSDASSDNLSFDVYFWGASQQADIMLVTDRVASGLRDLFNAKKVSASADERQLQPVAKAS